MSQIDNLLTQIICRYTYFKDKYLFLHPIVSDYLRPDVIKYLFACADEGVNEDDCVKKLSNIFYHDSENVCEKCKQNEKKVFEAAILFAYRTLKEYKEQLNARKNEKDNLTDCSACAITK